MRPLLSICGVADVARPVMAASGCRLLLGRFVMFVFSLLQGLRTDAGIRRHPCFLPLKKCIPFSFLFWCVCVGSKQNPTGDASKIEGRSGDMRQQRKVGKAKKREKIIKKTAYEWRRQPSNGCGRAMPPLLSHRSKPQPS